MSRSERIPGTPAAFRRIWSVVARIPRGRVATYGQVARMAGLGGGARTAGWALRALPDRLRIDDRTVPWHRVINAGGRISARGGDGGSLAAARQASRLRRDGVRIAANGAIDLQRYRWNGASGPSASGRATSSKPRSSS